MFHIKVIYASTNAAHRMRIFFKKEKQTLGEISHNTKNKYKRIVSHEVQIGTKLCVIFGQRK